MKHELTYSLAQLLQALIDQEGSDLHVTSKSPPRLRVNGQLLPLDLPALADDQTMSLCYSILTEEQKKDFESEKEIDLSFNIRGLARFRANIFLQRNCVGGVFRVIPTEIPSFENLGLPSYIEDLCKIPRGLVLITGPTGSGKSTTLAAMIDYINSRFQKHIVTIEDPIEFVHTNKKSVVSQRELGTDTISFSKALKSCLRQDPDVVLVGELRDLDTIALALTTAETGHLVFGTLHTNSCVASINRIIDAFPPNQQGQIRTQLSFSLMGVMSQLLIPTTNLSRVACIETMIPNSAIRSLIRDNKVHQIYSSMQIGQENSNMRTMNQALIDLMVAKKITQRTAIGLSPDPLEMQDLIVKMSSRNHQNSPNTPRKPGQKR